MRISLWMFAITAQLLIRPPQLGAESAATNLFAQANAAYEENRYEDAIELYRQILSAGVSSGTIFYNLGNAYFKDNQLGWAILSYERAQRLLPRDPDVAANLTLAREMVVDKIPLESPSPLLGVSTWPARSLNIDELTWLVFILYLMTAALVVTIIWIRRAGARQKFLVACLICGLLFGIAGASLAGRIYQQRIVSRAIVVTASVDARSGPDIEYTKIFTIHQGAKVRIRQGRQGWYLISLPNGLGGWVPGETVEII